MDNDFVQDALKALRPDTPNWYGWAKYDADGNKIPNDQRMCWEHAIVIQDGVTKPTKEEFDAKYNELIAEYENNKHQRQRAVEYPRLEEQLDYIYHYGVDAWKTDVIDPVKNKYPKPE